MLGLRPAADRDPKIFVEVSTNAASKSHPLMAARGTVRKRSIVIDGAIRAKSGGNVLTYAVRIDDLTAIMKPSHERERTPVGRTESAAFGLRTWFHPC